MTCFPAIRSRRFGMWIQKTSLRRLTHWPAPHWCCGEYNISRLLIARSCWICPGELSRLRISGLSVGMTSVRVHRDHRMEMGRSLAFNYTAAEIQPTSSGERKRAKKQQDKDKNKAPGGMVKRDRAESARPLNGKTFDLAKGYSLILLLVVTTSASWAQVVS